MWLHRYGQKLRTIYANCHQSFLLVIDQVLASPICMKLSPIEVKLYLYLKKLLAKKLKVSIAGKPMINAPKLKRSQRLSLFRLNNDVSLLNLKKIAKGLKSPNGV